MRMGFLVACVLLVAYLIGLFVAELAIINSNAIATASMADFVRYSLVLVMVIGLCYQVSQDYELNQFERLLAMPVTCFQYVAAQFLVMLSVAFLLSLPVLVLFSVVHNTGMAFYWAASLFLELVLVGQFALLAILSLEKLPLAVIFTISLYLLAKAAPIIALILSQSSHFYEEENSFQIASLLFSGLQYLLPDESAFAQNDLLFGEGDIFAALSRQLLSVLLYGMFLQFIILFDFYRKEFN